MRKKSEHLANAFFLALRKKSKILPLVDYGLPKPLFCDRKKLLLLSVKLGLHLKNNVDSRRIGVVLPPGLAGTVANLAIFFSGKVPVNLNFSLGDKVAQKLIQKAEIKTIVTAEKMMEKFPEFPWTNDIFEISSWLKGLVKSPHRLILEFILLLLPVKISAYLLRIPAKVVEEEATLLFTSGSSGEPKGVVLTHANILSNCQQIERLNLFDHEAKILANLPLFHSFGFTVATCFPILYNIPIVTVPSPLDVKLGLQAIRNEKITFLLGTPTFLRGFLSRAKKEDFISLRYVVAGAEKSPDSFKENWETFADCAYLEGYGLTETSPGISFNLPGNGSRKGSVGKLFTSIECKTINPETRCDQSLGKSGLLCFRGPNIFNGYLDEIEKTNEVLTDDGWLITGDLGYIDHEGFLYIEGRLSRFSKIGGEMVPHGTVEDEVRKILDPNRDENFGLVIIGQPDESKGEQLILVIDKEINFPELRKKLTLKGIPNLWIPKKVKKIQEIPVLPTGKTDIFKIEKELEW